MVMRMSRPSRIPGLFLGITDELLNLNLQFFVPFLFNFQNIYIYFYNLYFFS